MFERKTQVLHWRHEERPMKETGDSIDFWF